MLTQGSKETWFPFSLVPNIFFFFAFTCRAAKDGTVIQQGWTEESDQTFRLGYQISKLSMITMTRIQAEEADRLNKDILINCVSIFMVPQETTPIYW